MKKNNIFIFLMFVFAISTKANAQPKIIIEGNNKKIVHEDIAESTVKQALDVISRQKNIEIVYSQSGANINLYSVDGIKNNDLDKNAIWLGYIIRNNVLIVSDDYLELEIEENDYVYLYYGNKNTQKISNIDFKSNGSIINFELKDERLEKDKILESPITNKAKLSIKSPDGSKKILITDNKGRAYTKFDAMGIYEVSASNPNQTTLPTVVNFGPLYFFHGLKDKESTRGEFIKFVMDKLSDFRTNKPIKFIDLDEDTPYFDEIKKASDIGIVVGYGDNTLRPDNKITLLEATLILSNLFSDDITTYKELKDVPIWANQKVSIVLQSKLLNDLELDFDKYLTTKDFTIIYNNYFK